MTSHFDAIMTKRKAISKADRLAVYNKYNGHCAYCGCMIDYKDMQVDHIVSIYAHNGDNTMDNYMPACRMCNLYKSTYTLDVFREQIESLHERLEKQFIYRLAKKYGLIEEHPERIKFYFEIMEEQHGKAYKEVITTVKELVDKATPKELAYEGDDCDENGVIYDTAICPSCDKHFEIEYDEHAKYCPDCGQALNWGEVDER